VGGLMGFLKHLIKSTYYKHHNNNYDFQDYRGYGGFVETSPMLRHFLKKSKKLIYIFIAVIGMVLLLFIVLLIALSPLILNGIDWIYHNGISGIIKLLQAILDKLWKGAGA
jgi:hypothetical protein